LKSTFQGNSPYRFPDGHKVVNEGPGDGNDYGKRISLIKATEESVNTAYMDLTASIEHGPKQILDTAVDMGVPRDASGLAPISGIALGSAIVSPIDMANSYATIADRGQAKDWYAVTRVQRRGRTEFEAKPKKDQHQALPEDIDADVSYALQRVVKNGTGQNAMELGRPAAGKTGTATNNDGDVSSSWFVGYTPQLSTAVMYVRGDGNDPLNNYLPSYFGAVYPTQTWTAVMERALAGAPIKDFPPPAWVSKTLPGHNPLPTYTPTPTPSPTPSPTHKWPDREHPPHPGWTPTCSSWPCIGNQDGNGNGNGNGHGWGHHD
jgi:membrane peptidoglycan carboxypeptidase